MFENEIGKSIDRRSFLRGSALFAGAIGLAVAPALAQQAPQQPETKEEPKDPFAEDGKDGEKKLIDKEGREYRICPQCGYNMYKQDRTWSCENCGYSYTE